VRGERSKLCALIELRTIAYGSWLGRIVVDLRPNDAVAPRDVRWVSRLFPWSRLSRGIWIEKDPRSRTRCTAEGVLTLSLRVT
jgi:hypothetical protein